MLYHTTYSEYFKENTHAFEALDFLAELTQHIPPSTDPAHQTPRIDKMTACYTSTSPRYACTRIQFGRSVDDSSIESAKSAGLICKLFYSDENVEAEEYVARGIDVILTNRAQAIRVDSVVCRRYF